MKHLEKRVVVKMDMSSKARYRFANGQEIIMERDTDNMNYRYKQPVNAEVVSAEGIPAGVKILIHHHGVQPTYQIFDHGELSGDNETSQIKYFSIPEEACYVWQDKSGRWNPLKDFATGLRVFKAYSGVLHGVAPIPIKNTLYITSGIFEGKIVRTLKAADYEIIFMNDQGRDESIIRCRYHEDDPDHIRNEIIAIDEDLTKKLKNGSILVGITPNDAHPITI